MQKFQPSTGETNLKDATPKQDCIRSESSSSVENKTWRLRIRNQSTVVGGLKHASLNPLLHLALLVNCFLVDSNISSVQDLFGEP